MLEDFFIEMTDKYEKVLKEKYDVANIDKLVNERALEIIKEHADNLIEKLDNIRNVLDDPTNILTPFWDRNK